MDELEDHVPFIEDITSLINARNTRGESNELIVEDFLENWPNDQKELGYSKKPGPIKPDVQKPVTLGRRPLHNHRHSD